MKLKLTPSQAQALFNLFNDEVLPNHTNDLDKQLVMLHMIAIYKRLRDKYEGEPRTTYSVSLTQAEALAYRIYWRDNALPMGSYEWAFILDHCGKIDGELSALRRIHHTNSNNLLTQ